MTDAGLVTLCARAGAALRTLDLDAPVYVYTTSPGVVAALRDGGCTGLRRFAAPTHLVNGYKNYTHHMTSELVWQLVAACPVLEHTAFSVSGRLHMGLSDENKQDVAAVALAAAALPGPLTLRIYGCQYDQYDFPTVPVDCRLLLQQRSVVAVELLYCTLHGEAAAAFIEAFRSNSTLELLDLTGNQFYGDVIAPLAAALRENTTLKLLILDEASLEHAGAVALADALRVNASLALLYLAYSGIGDQGVAALADALRLNASLTTLNLAHNHIGPEGAAALAAALRVNTTLTSLELFENNLGPEGIAALTEVQHVNATCRITYQRQYG